MSHKPSSRARKKSARVPSYRLHKASGQVVVKLSGRDVHLGRHGRPESLQRYARAIARGQARPDLLGRINAALRKTIIRLDRELREARRPAGAASSS